MQNREHRQDACRGGEQTVGQPPLGSEHESNRAGENHTCAGAGVDQRIGAILALRLDDRSHCRGHGRRSQPRAHTREQHRSGEPERRRREGDSEHTEHGDRCGSERDGTRAETLGQLRGDNDGEAVAKKGASGDQAAHGVRQSEISIDLRQEQTESETGEAVAHRDQAETRDTEVPFAGHARPRRVSRVAARPAVATAAGPR